MQSDRHHPINIMILCLLVCSLLFLFGMDGTTQVASYEASDHYTATADSSTTLTTAPAVSHSPLATVSLRQYAYGTTIIKPAPFFLHPAFFMFSFLFLLLFLWDFFKHTYFLPLHTTLFYQEHSLSEWLICQSCHGKKRISIRPL